MMHLNKKNSLQIAIGALDCVIAFTAPMVAIAFRQVIESRFDVTWDILPYAVSSSVASIILLWWFGVSRAAWRYFAFSDAVKALQAIALAVALGSLIGFSVNRLENVSRAIPFLQAAWQISAFVAVRLFLQRLLSKKAGHRAARPGGVLVIGCNPTAEAYIRAVELLSHGALEVVGILAEDPAMVGLTVRGKLVIGTISQIDSALTSLKVHGIELKKIAVAVPENALSSLHHAALDKIVANYRMHVIWLSDLFGQATGIGMGEEEAHPKIERALGLYGPVKACIDIVGAGVLLLLLSPLFGCVVLLTLIDGGRPVFFWQKRLGRRGRSITLYKFRTMRSPIGPSGELLDDSQRTSAIGRFLRKSRLDELPQLLHILKGEMSFVGPRPLLPVDQPQEVMGRLSVKPGLTGWAQVNYAYGETINDSLIKLQYDLYYIKHRSIFLDINIVLKTFSTVLFYRGQ